MQNFDYQAAIQGIAGFNGLINFFYQYQFCKGCDFRKLIEALQNLRQDFYNDPVVNKVINFDLFNPNDIGKFDDGYNDV